MSLDLLNGIKKFEVPHMKGVLVQIRIGLNTGPCVAGEAARGNERKPRRPVTGGGCSRLSFVTAI